MPRRLTGMLLAFALVLVAPSAAGAQAALPSCDGPPFAGSPALVSFLGPPAEIETGRRYEFSLVDDSDEWDYTTSDVHVTMSEAGVSFFSDDASPDDFDDDGFLQLWIRADAGDGPLTVTASYSEFHELTALECARTVSRVTTPIPPKVRPVRLACNWWDFDGDHHARLTARPRRCAVWPDWMAHADGPITFIKARWRNWGKRTARARVTLTGNMGSRAPGRIKAWRLRRDCSGKYMIYTRVTVVEGFTRRWTVSADRCRH